jgi:sugar-specific transcriptional regulator TrmB
MSTEIMKAGELVGYQLLYRVLRSIWKKGYVRTEEKF